MKGEPIPDVDCSGTVTRTKYSAPERGQQAYFRSVPEGIRSLCIDIDKLKLPRRLSLTKRPKSVVRYVVSRLPDYFHNVTCHWQFSASAGMSDDNKVSLHLWYWLDRPLSDSEAKRWAKSVNAIQKLIDAALYSPVQVHYTAAPIFDDDIRDPLPRRSGLLEGEEDYVRFPEVPQEPVRPRAKRERGLERSESFEELLERVGDHAGGEGFHEPLRDAAWAYVSEHGNNTDREALKEQLRQTVHSADASDHTEQEVDDRASDEHLYGLIDSAIEKVLSSEKKRLIQGIPPHFPWADEL